MQAVAAFHPEVMHTPDGAKLLRNFALEIAGFKGDWTMAAFKERGGPSVTIKSHHNVGGLPERMHLKLVEPLGGRATKPARQRLSPRPTA